MTAAQLDPGHVHYQLIELPAAGSEDGASLLARLSPLLSSDERDRAAKFAIEQAHIQYVAARVTLRRALAGYLGIDPAAVRFAKAERGKPYLPDHAIRFNVSHSGQLALLAFSRDLELGVDVEQVWADDDPFALADRFFSPAEIAALSALPADQRRGGFFDLWTRKEAYIKARGDGLHLSLSSFDVTCGPGVPARLLASRNHPDDVAHFAMFNLAVPDGYRAAVVAERPGGAEPTVVV